MLPALSDIAEREYVLLTTFRRTGVPVATPVWIVRDGEHLLITTGADSGKVKRLRHTARITLAPCDARGRVTEDIEPVAAIAIVDASGPTMERVDRALAGKYGLKHKMIRASQRLKRTTSGSVALVVT
ncbi:hypothetical protein ASD65_16945 [Microbacterium sp. Root61]|uniref:PPOX class F420-dependent oxidoreductase n=1 Tax=Microbacterium sp. Root61 TaxID=1736570 RepID=UPI0006F81185|nr:PPOX class F420-dependent oxidoreductase [Microbacterium sp. Root61]KRA22194.1 hypothetical protein ASD65_16945 [Microbacterium sp. Root61]